MTAVWDNPQVDADARAHALRDWPHESVGLVVDGCYIPVANKSETPEDHFAFDTVLMLTPGLQAVVHSHPKGDYSPSKLDMEQQEASALPWGIVGCSQDYTKKIFWWGADVPTPPVLGRPYRFGPSGSDGAGDCYAVIKDWFKDNRGVPLREVARDEASYAAGTPWYDTLFSSYGWTRIDPDEMGEGDVLLLRVRMRVTNHAMLYLGNGKALHHQVNCLSAEIPIGPWLRFKTHCIRYGAAS